MTLSIRALLVAAVVTVLTSASHGAGSAPAGFDLYHLNGPKSQPATVGDVTTFHITPGDCNKVKYNNNENDCINHSTHGALHRIHDAKLGESYEYAFDMWTDPGFAYQGTF